MLMLARAVAVLVLAAGPALADGAPACSEHPGLRVAKGPTLNVAETDAVIAGSANRQLHECTVSAELRLSRKGNERSVVLGGADNHDFALVDFSPDGTTLLIAASERRPEPDELNRYVSIAAVPVATGEFAWFNVWDVMAWGDCDATVEPRGFTRDGRIAIRAAPSVMATKRRADCVDTVSLYAVDLTARTTAPLSPETRIDRIAETISPRSQTCKTDPDIVRACFAVKGRLSYWNGNPTARIAVDGTSRILGVREPVLAAVARGLDWDHEAEGDFTLCPFTAQVPGKMQFVCMESAAGLTYKARERNDTK